jgi:hypothetical protein
MVETVRTEQLALLPEYQEQYLKDLLASTTARVEQPLYVPERRVAPLTPAQQQAINLGISGVGSYFPMMQAGEGTIAGGVGTYEEAIRQALGAQPYLTAAGQQVQQAMAGAQPYQGMATQATRLCNKRRWHQALQHKDTGRTCCSTATVGTWRHNWSRSAQRCRHFSWSAGYSDWSYPSAQAAQQALRQAAAGGLGETGAAQQAAQQAITGARDVTSRAGEQILGAAGGLAPITQEALSGCSWKHRAVCS